MYSEECLNSVEALKGYIRIKEDLQHHQEVVSRSIDLEDIIESCEGLYRKGLGVRDFLTIVQKYHSGFYSEEDFNKLCDLEFNMYFKSTRRHVTQGDK